MLLSLNFATVSAQFLDYPSTCTHITNSLIPWNSYRGKPSDEATYEPMNLLSWVTTAFTHGVPSTVVETLALFITSQTVCFRFVYYCSFSLPLQTYASPPNVCARTVITVSEIPKVLVHTCTALCTVSECQFMPQHESISVVQSGRIYSLIFYC